MAKSKKPKFKFSSYVSVDIEWEDAHSRGVGWDSPENYLEQTAVPIRCRTIGYLLDNPNKDYVTVVQNLASNGDVGQAMTIPLAWVIKMKKVKI